MAKFDVSQYVASSEIDRALEDMVMEIETNKVDLSIGGSLDEDFAAMFARSQENAKIQQNMVQKIEAQQRLEASKALAIRQNQVGSPGNIRAPARIRNRV